MHAQVAVNHFSGSILIARGVKVDISKGYGLAEVKSGVPNASTTRYRLGSIAEQFTAMAILQLQERGKLHVQDSVCKYNIQCPSDWEKITLFDLMIHTSGIPEISNAFDCEISNLRPPSISQLVGRITKEPLRFKPGERFDYSNSDGEVLDAVIEAASGESYTTYLDRHIFMPVGMRHTGYDSALRIPSQSGALPLLMPSDVQRSLPYTAGGVYSTIEDLYLWDRALAADKVASPKSLQQMFTPHRDGYGFGWMIRKELDRRVVTQGGGLRLYSTSILRYPDDDACVIVLSNSESTDTVRVGQDLAAILFGKSYELPREHNAIKPDPASYSEFAGQYALTPNFILTVTKEGDRLMIQGTGQVKTELLPESGTRFFTVESDATVNFMKMPDGRVSEMILQQSGRDIPVARIN